MDEPDRAAASRRAGRADDRRLPGRQRVRRLPLGAGQARPAARRRVQGAADQGRPDEGRAAVQGLVGGARGAPVAGADPSRRVRARRIRQDRSGRATAGLEHRHARRSARSGHGRPPARGPRDAVPERELVEPAVADGSRAPRPAHRPVDRGAGPGRHRRPGAVQRRRRLHRLAVGEVRSRPDGGGDRHLGQGHAGRTASSSTRSAPGRGATTSTRPRRARSPTTTAG